MDLRLLALMAALAPLVANGFQTMQPKQPSLAPPIKAHHQRLLMAHQKNDDVPSGATEKPHRLQRLRNKAAAAIIFGTATGGFWNLATPQHAEASAPVMAVPKAEQRDPGTDAMLNHERKMVAKQQAEIQAMNKKAREIEAKEGVKARVKFEREYKAQKDQEAKDRAEQLIKLKRSLLLEQGIDPWVDIEGERQVVLHEKGIDLGKIPGTMMYLEKTFESSNYKKSNAFKTENNRRVIKAMAQDMDNKGIDILEYFESHMDKTQGILKMPPQAAAQLADKYEANLEKYGQIDEPNEGEMSVKEKMAKSGGQVKALVDKAAVKKEKAEAKAKAQAEKAKAKAEKAAKKEEAKRDKAAQKAAAATAAAVAAASAGVSAAEAGVNAATQTAPETRVEQPAYDDKSSGGMTKSKGDDNAAAISAESTETDDANSVAITTTKKKAPVVPLIGVGVVAVGGGGYAFKVMQERAAADEEERQRQFRMLMGEADDKPSSPTSVPPLEVVESDDDDVLDDKPAAKSTSPPPSSIPPPAKKKRLSFFGKKNKNGRPTDLSVLTDSETSEAPEFATLLAKILTYGAPGRFPAVEGLPGGMPFTEFDLEAAKQKLIDKRKDSGIALEESAEIFAGVVNCMLIDIVDLAAATLKAKDSKLTEDGINVVIDFMNHAASLYDSVAEGITITPVTYGGSLSKGQLEKMYSAYAASGMMNMGMDSDFDSRVGLLQDVFEISPKKAEGIAMKAMQKSMMEMMKDGKGMEEMMEKLGGAEGLEGLAGLGGMDGEANPEDMDPEQLKTMLLGLKEMKESGAIDPSEFELVKDQFKEAYGGNIEDVIKEGDENSEMFGEHDKELLDLMKSLLYD